MRNIIYINKNRDGAALVFVVIIMMIIGIISMSIATVFNSNLRQTKYQQDSLEAYYLAYSGALVAYEALLDGEPSKYYVLTNGGSLSPQNMSFDNGNVTVTAVVSTDKNFEDLIKIVSTSTLTRNNFKYTRTMYFDPANTLDILWKSN